jgi:phage terminase large subunit-like protein
VVPSKKTPTTSSRKKSKATRKVEKIARDTPPPVVESKTLHLDKSEKYIDDVLSGKIPACAYVKAAVKRQRDDLVRLAKHPIYYWSAEHGARVCRFIERLPHVKGDKAKAKELFVLEGWQCFVIMTVFGWRRKDTGGRRFKRAYVEVPRGNGKSALSSGIGLYCLAADGEQGAEVYSAATTREQSKVVWETAKAMMQKRPEFASKIGVDTSQYSIFKESTHSKFMALSREANNQDGLNVHCAVIDELHAHKTRDTYDVIETASAKRTSSLIWVITTAGSDTAGICYEVRGYIVKILEGLEDDSQFGIIYTVDEGDDWTAPATWIKANPNWNVSVIPDTFAALAFKAMQTPSAQSNFKTKHLNIWMNADVAAFDMHAWDKCADANLKLDSFAGQDCFVSVDLASKIDIAARAHVFVKRVKREQPPTVIEAIAGLAGNPDAVTDLHYYLFVTSYLPEAAITDGRNSQYSGWDIEGWLTTTPGDVLDYGVVKEDLLKDGRDFKVREIAYDPWQATQMAQELVAEGLTMVEMRPSVQNFSAPMKELDALMRGGRLHHNMNPVMRWMVSNTVCHTDAKDNIYPRKERPENKIDGVVAAIMALGRAMNYVPPESKKPRIRVLGAKSSS